MKTTYPLVGIVMVAALAGCGDDNPSQGAAGGGAAGAMSTGGAGGGVSGTAAGGTSGSGGGGTGGMAPQEPFKVTDGVCYPTPMPGPEPIYEIGNTFGHIGAMAAHH